MNVKLEHDRFKDLLEQYGWKCKKEVVFEPRPGLFLTSVYATYSYPLGVSPLPGSKILYLFSVIRPVFCDGLEIAAIEVEIRTESGSVGYEENHPQTVRSTVDFNALREWFDEVMKWVHDTQGVEHVFQKEYKYPSDVFRN